MASENIITLSDADFKEKISGSEVPVLVDFWAEWCGPCKMIAPELEKLAGELTGKVQVAKINVDDNRGTPGEYQVMSIPTMVLFKDGREVERIIGFRKADELKKMIEKHL
ncbi:thioredoxin 1 [Desulfohalotomaculum tongense]|uniref:thioredoxin n=1 Tax=Desulforadius tongensis TaxID=1216062 RepID=UPI00195F16A1|nr:thioredoxin [Desulforadius tongensis]MBM7855014.1 thioredoxin 1 [Desulforadius tongensis]